MKIIREACAGTPAREDLQVKISPNPEGIQVIVHSSVVPLFGAQIEAAARELLARHKIEACRIEIEDKSALDYVVQARIETAIERAVEETV